MEIVMDLVAKEKEIIPLKERIKTAIPSKNGLFPHEILALHYAPTFYVNQEVFQEFWKYYGVLEMNDVLSSLLSRGFLKVGTLEDVLKIQKSDRLKIILKTNDLNTSGKKENLIKTILDKIPHTELDKLFPDKTYSLTDTGIEELKNGEYIVYVHNHGIEDLDIWSLNKVVGNQPHRYRDKIWQYLNMDLSRKYLSKGDFGLYRNLRYRMSRFLNEEKKFKGELALLVEVMFCDLSGLPNNYNENYFIICSDSFFPYEKSLATIPEGIIYQMICCQKELGYSDDELKNFLTEEMNGQVVRAPIQLFTKEECVQIILFEKDNNKEELKKLYANAGKEFKKKLKDYKASLNKSTNLSNGNMSITSSNNRLRVLILAIFFGYLGFHRFYVGRIITGLLMLCTLGLCGIWWLLDVISILKGEFCDADGNFLKW